ncbi:MAG TPA: serine/threonine-protein kinase [Labilithrix sp.]|nr:serine/threonine-protein kinase [Labilithrix sp.]
MGSSVSLGRALSLSAPIASESERAHFQERLTRSLLIVFAMSFGFFMVQLTLVVALSLRNVGDMFRTSSLQLHLATTFLALACGLWLRRGPRSARVLDVLDVVSTLTLCAGWALMIMCDVQASERNSQLIALLATSYTLATRAALVPSTPGRSAALGLGSILPLLPVAYLTHAGVRGGSFDAVMYTSIWGLVAIACTTSISHVIYGLRLQVQQAMQLGQYLLEEKIGEGAMGVVYRASHTMLRRPCAIKLLSGTTSNAATRFEREVQITAKLTHPNTVVVFDYGRTPDGAFYYAMEYIEGITLEDLVREFGPQPPARVVHILLQMCGALEEAHASGLVHRDIKPSNVMLAERGRVLDTVKVLDFGLVRETAQLDLGVSSVDTILGTPHFMAPESILEPSSVDARTDLYAVGATAYYLLTGDHVFGGGTLVEICSHHIHRVPVPPSARAPAVAAALDEVVLACLAKKPEDRPADAAELAARLRACNVDAWTRDDARDFWARPEAKRTAPRPDVRAGRRAGSTTAFGNTVAVALEGRRA